MYRSVQDFLNDWKHESRSTLKVLHALTDEAADRKVTPDGRSLGFIAWHITVMLKDMLGHAGLTVDGPAVDAPQPATVAEIAEAYERSAASVAEQVRSQWTDDALDVGVEAYGVSFTRGSLLGALIKHEVHHRGQMTVLMRQAGLRVPGVYGPAREEWAAMGMPAMA